MELSVEQAYLSAFYFLDKFWNKVQQHFDKSKLDELGGFLGGMSPYLFENRMSADPAKWAEWNGFVKQLIIKHEQLTLEEAFTVMIAFIDFYYKSFFKDLDIVFAELQLVKNNKTGDYLTWEDWLECAAALN